MISQLLFVADGGTLCLPIANRCEWQTHPTMPRGTPIADRRRAGEARPRGKAGSDRRKTCFHPGGSGFHLPRGGGSAAFQFYQLGFYVARSLLWYFPCTPRATALRQARVSGGNLQNCAPSAACGGAMAPRKYRNLLVSFVSLVPSVIPSGPGRRPPACRGDTPSASGRSPGEKPCKSAQRWHSRRRGRSASASGPNCSACPAPWTRARAQ